jgi:hypothetical protein
MHYTLYYVKWKLHKKIDTAIAEVQCHDILCCLEEDNTTVCKTREYNTLL